MITVFGLGFVGLTTALGFAHYGNKVYGIDSNNNRIDLLKSNKLPFLEPQMEEILINQNNNNFFITKDIKEALDDSKFIFYCVGTPYGEKGEADLTYLFQAIEQTLSIIERDSRKILIIKSTIPPSTTKEKIIPFIEGRGFEINKDIFVANNPEFLREGHCWEDFIDADRIVVGCEDESAIKTIRDLYKSFNIPFFSVSYNTGEFIKYLSNTLLATMISYSNEMSNIADSIGDINISKSFKILHLDKRWGNGTMSSYVYPGCGYGGYCLPKDTNALMQMAKNNGYNPNILENVIKLNEDMISHIVNKILNNITKNTKIGILGLSFKPKSNDVRESVSAKIIENLIRLGYSNIAAHDPIAIQEFKDYYNFSISYIDNFDEIYNESDILVVLTGWDEYKVLSMDNSKKVLDFRYIL